MELSGEAVVHKTIQQSSISTITCKNSELTLHNEH